MTLLVAGISGSNPWMVADTAIGGDHLTTRQRAYEIKIEPSRDGCALLGFAGDVHYGRKFLEEAALLPAGARAVDALVGNHRWCPSVDFAYAYIDQAGPHLVRISEGSAREISAFYIGLPDAFDHFQRIRHDKEIDFTPEAIRTLVCGSRSSQPIPEPAYVAITSMLRLFVERSRRDVGGWPIAYFLTSEGAFFCGYGYSVSDPILGKVDPGSIVPHGSSEAGGFSLSVTEFGRGKGVVVYWLQQPGGMVFVRTADGYDARRFDGIPSLFKQSALAALGEPVDLLFSDEPHGPLQSIAVLRDEGGIPCMTRATHGDGFSFSILNTRTPFRVKAPVISLRPDNNTEMIGGQLSTDQFSISISDDRRSATLRLLQDGQLANHVTLQAAGIDSILAKLGEARAVMSEPVSVRPPQDTGTRELAVLDPVWRMDPPLHPGLGGVILRLRHLGFGRLTFVLPHHEARSLGRWLCEYKQPHREGDA